jgi:phosphomannomutase/phosphoglucomutase
VEQAMLDYFPEVISLKIIAIDEMGTAEIEGGDRGLRNHIEVDLVRRASLGEKTHAEAYKFENRWLTSMTALVTHPRIADRKAVIIVTLDNEQIGKQLKSLDSAAGKFALEQEFASASGGPRVNVIAFSGSGDASDYTQRAEIPDTPWRVAFTPSRALLDTLAVKPWPLFAVLAASVVAALCAIGLLLTLFPRRLGSEINRVISAADRKTPLELAIPELVGIAKQLRRATLWALRQSSAPAPSQLPVAEVQENFEETGAPAELTNPMFQSASILDEDDEGTWT